MARRGQFKDDAKPESKRRREKNRREAKDRASRNAARRDAIKRGVAKKGDGKDIDHKDGNPSNNSRSNLRAVAPGKNRSLKGSKNGMSKKKKYADGGEVSALNYQQMVQELYGQYGESMVKDMAQRGIKAGGSRVKVPGVQKPQGPKMATTLRGGGKVKKRRK
jgi:hypothetical protein